MPGHDWLPEIGSPEYNWHFIGDTTTSCDDAMKWCETELGQRFRLGFPASTMYARVTAGRLIRSANGDLFDPELSAGALHGRPAGDGSITWSAV